MNYWNLHKEFRSLGGTNEAQTAAACHLFIELCEVRQKTNLKYFYNAELNLVYLTLSNADAAVECFYLAKPSSETLDLTAFESIRAKLIARHAHECHDADKVQLILAIVDPNSTIVYYRLTLDLISLNSLKVKRSSLQSKVCDSEQAHSSGANAIV